MSHMCLAKLRGGWRKKIENLFVGLIFFLGSIAYAHKETQKLGDNLQVITMVTIKLENYCLTLFFFF